MAISIVSLSPIFTVSAIVFSELADEEKMRIEQTGMAAAEASAVESGRLETETERCQESDSVRESEGVRGSDGV